MGDLAVQSAVGEEMKERPILFSKITGQPSQRGKRLMSKDGLSWRERNREAVNARKRELYAACPGKHQARIRRYRQEHADVVRRANRIWRAEFWPALRAEMIVAYGDCCACCGESETQFLQLDHIHNDGAESRRIHKNGQQEVLALKRAGWPAERHQLLCANCNFGKSINGGVCPHKA